MSKDVLVGKVIKSVSLAEDNQAIRFDFEGEESIIVFADGDCCSYSWIEAVQGIEQIIGSKIVSVEDVDGIQKAEDTKEGNYIQFYGCKITSEKGYALIDYRNSSNGYYGGSLIWPGDHFYGGVYGQNQSDCKWKEVK